MRVYLYENNTPEEIDGVLSGEVLNWRADDTLDSGTIRFVSDGKTPIKPTRICRLAFEKGDGTSLGTNDLMVSADSVEPYGKHGDYLHTLSLVELTKILEKYFVNSFVARAKDGRTLANQFDKALANINVQIGNETTLVFSSALTTRISGYQSQDFNIQNATVREVFDELLSAIDCRCEVTSISETSTTRTITVGCIDLNNLTAKTISNRVGTYAQNNVDNFNGKMVSVTSNATPQKLVKQTDTFKTSATTTASSDDRTIQFAYPVEYVTELNLIYDFKPGVTWTDTDGQAHTEMGFNLPAYKIPFINSKLGSAYKDYFVDKEYYNTLSSSQQDMTLYYTRGETSANVSETYKHFIVTYSKYKEASADACTRYLTENGKTIFGSTFASLTALSTALFSFDNAFFEVTYAPLIDTMVEVTKDYENADNGLVVIDGQSASTLDLSRYGRNLLGKAQRIGNDEYIIDCTCDSFTDILEPLNYITEDSKKLVVYKTDIQVMSKVDYATTEDKNWYKVRYYLTENYNNLYERVALAREKRIYEIPLSGYKTIVPIRETIKYGTNTYGSIPSGAQSGDENTAYSVIAYLGETLTEQTNLKPIENMLIQTESSRGATYGTFCLPVVGFGCGNTMNFVAKFYDNYSSGLSIDGTHSIFDWVGGKKVVYNPYVDSNGECVALKNIKLANPTSVTSSAISARPKTASGETFKEFSNDASVTYYKDGAESLQVQKIYEFRSSDECVLTPQLLEDNNAYISGSRELSVYTGCTFKQGQTMRTDGEPVGRAGTVLLGEVDKVNGKYNYYIWPVDVSASYSNVIICDANGIIYAYIDNLTLNNKLVLTDERTY